MGNINIIYGSTGGNTEIVCIKLAELFEKKGFSVSLNSSIHAKIEHIDKSQLIILACPTYGHGILEKNFSSFFELFKTNNFANKKFAIVGLGDYKYDIDYHYESIRILENAIQNSNGDLIGTPLRIFKSPYKFIKTLIPKWTDELTNIIQ